MKMDFNSVRKKGNSIWVRGTWAAARRASQESIHVLGSTSSSEEVRRKRKSRYGEYILFVHLDSTSILLQHALCIQS